jgi:hypothetical protein
MGFMRTNEAMHAAAFSKDEERWAAVLRRDRSAQRVRNELPKRGAVTEAIYDAG